MEIISHISRSILIVLLLSFTSVDAQKKKASKFNYKEAIALQPLNQAPAEEFSLWYNQPATFWEEALPVGNGRLGAMVYGGVAKEMIQLNEESIWAGPPIPEVKENVLETVNEVRALLFAGKYKEAQDLQQSIMPERISPRSYQTMGELNLDYGFSGKASNYRRDLNLDTAIATTQFTKDGVNFVRQVTVCPVNQVILVNVKADRPGAVSFTASVTRHGKFEVKGHGGDTLIAHGQASHGDVHLGVKFATAYRAVAQNGEVQVKNGKIVVRSADEVTIYIAAATDYNRNAPARPLAGNLSATCMATIDRAASKGFSSIKTDAVASHRELFRRVELKMGKPSNKPTLSRLLAYSDKKKAPKIDPNFEALYFQYGRYLLITSSREGCLPANLQGIWCKDMEAPWNSDYHININAQMNYWPAEITNLSECHRPFLDYIERLVPSGQKTAQDLYGHRGFLAGHTSDVWHGTVPFGRVQYGQWVVGGAWCTQHFMEHYRFTGNREFLQERAYPILKEASLFFLDWLVEDPQTGQLVSGPSTSPENKFLLPGVSRERLAKEMKLLAKNKTTNKERDALLYQKHIFSNLTMGPSMDQQIIWDVYTNTLEAAEILGIEDSFVKEVERSLSNLALPQIGSDGRLMEWTQEFDEFDSGHRHISHLFGLYPGHQYHSNNAPEVVAAARKSIDARLAEGGGHTGWSRAWIINFWARFKDAEKAHDNIVMLLRKSTYNNLFDKHAPFQIDGNFGGAAGFAEVLLQSHANEIELLPALPNAWADGSVKGLCARGGFEVAMEWKDGELVAATLRSNLGQSCQLRYAEKLVQFDTEAGGTYDLMPLLEK